MKKAILICMLALTALLTCGCEFELSTQELYSLPKLPAEYTELDNRINAILAEGAEYAAPTSGRNIQPVQLEDLNGDDREEAVAFFRNTSDEKPLKICIFNATEDSYELGTTIESSGAGIYSIAYSDLNNDGTTEMIVGWRVAADQQALVVYTFRGSEAVELMRTNYVRYTLADLDQDRMQEIVVLRAEGETGGVADYYGWQDGGLVPRVSARISITMAELSQQGRITMGVLQEKIPAVFVTGVEDSAWAVTDILTLRNGELTNIALSDATGVSGEIAPFRSLYPSDINSDGVTEVPCPVEMPGWSAEENSGYYWTVWRSYDEEGNASTALNTYHDVEDGWYLLLPEAWWNQITVFRNVSADEAVVTFYLRNGQNALPFMRISAITGSNRNVKAMRSGRFILSRQAETIYTAELLEPNAEWDLGIAEDEVREAFNLITREWMYGDN